MNYLMIYEKLINRAKDRSIDGYTEKHHIIPKCIGGTNDPSNLVKLTPEEHYLAHLLLIKIHPSIRGLLYAVKMMSGQGNNKSYGWIKRKISATGFTKEHRENISRSQKQMQKDRKKSTDSIKLITPRRKTKAQMSLAELEQYFKIQNDKRRKKKDDLVITALIYSLT